MAEQRVWILLRGLARQAEHWGPFKNQFQARFPADRVLTPDLPGIGSAKNETAPITMRETMLALRSRVLSEHEGPFSVFAVSLGAMVAMAWLDQFPREIESAFLLNSSSDLSPFYKRLRWEVWAEFLSVLRFQNPRAAERRILELVSQNEQNRLSFLPLWERIHRSQVPPPSLPLRQLLAARNFKVPAPSQAFRKACFLVSLGDRLVEPDCSRALAQHFGCQLIEHPWGGHDLPIDDPDWLLQVIEKSATSLRDSQLDI